MSERKVVNKYFPPDFDPAKIPRRSKSQQQQQQINVRIMLPISIRCGTCGTYIYRGTKFNSRKEDVLDQTYLGIQIYRFYIKCKECSVEILLNTDPAGKSGYVVEAGARRTFEPEADDEKEVGDAVEIRRLASKRELGIHSALDELKSMKARRAHLSVDSILESLQPQSAPLQLEEEKEYQQQLDMFKRSRRVVSVDLMLQDWQPLQKQQVDIFQGSQHDHDHDDLHKKRKPSYYYLSVPKKSSAPKTQETTNGLTLLGQHYDSIDEEA